MTGLNHFRNDLDFASPSTSPYGHSAFPPAEVKIIPVPYPFKERSHPHSERQMHNILLQMLQQQGEFK